MDKIQQKILEFVKHFTEMEIDGLVINCPYWMNRLKNSKVTLRGFANGKGSAQQIREELLKRLKKLTPRLRFEKNPENLRKFAKRERIGIDCSGFGYRVLEQLYKNLDKVFEGGINKTNVKRLTNPNYSKEIRNIKDFRLGDMIRLWSGKHIAVIIDINDKEIVYAHCSSLSTQIQGAHTSAIKIIDAGKTLADQIWKEKTKTGENFGKKRFNPQRGDGVFRLKIFS